MPDEPVPFYPAMPCHMAPLRYGCTPMPGCDCRICHWASGRIAGELALDIDGPVKPGTLAWGALLALAGVPA